MLKKRVLVEVANVLYSFLSGTAIALGGILYLSVDNKVIGALLFTLGLFTVCTKSLHLFTGKIGYLPDALFKKNFFEIFSLTIVWLGNFAGTATVGYLMRMTRFADKLILNASSIASTKLSDDLGSIFILAIFCGALMYLAVDNFKNNQHSLGKYLGLFLCVAGFILAGFEHCIANMFYFSVADVWTPKAFGYLLIMTLGNTLGSFIFPLSQKLFFALNKKQP